MLLLLRWAYLEPIFGRGTLENSRFCRIDKEWRSILTQIKKNNYRVVPITRIVNITNALQQLVRNLNQCQNTLQTFLEVSFFMCLFYSIDFFFV